MTTPTLIYVGTGLAMLVIALTAFLEARKMKLSASDQRFYAVVLVLSIALIWFSLLAIVVPLIAYGLRQGFKWRSAQ